MEEQVINQENEEKSLSLGELLFIAKRNWLIILIITLVCAAIGGIYGFCFKEKSYTASNTSMVMVDLNKEGMKNTNEYTAYMYSTYLINTYESFIKSHHVIDYTINALQNEYGYNDLTYDTIVNNLKFSSNENSLIVILSYTAHGDDKEMEAIHVVNTLLNKSIYIANNETEDGKLKFTVLADSIVPIDEAFESVGKRGATIITLVAFLIGLVISFVVCLIKYLKDDTFKSKDDFKRIVGVDILASIPEIVDMKGETK